MRKDFTIWHAQKSNLHENKIRLHFHERDIWFTSVGANMGIANLSQLRLIDSKRLKYQIGMISEKDFHELKKRVITLIK